MVQLNWTFLALNDLKAIFEYISKDSKNYDKLEILKIKRKPQILKVQPLIGEEVIEIANIAVSELVEGKNRSARKFNPF
jgi:toxin ParE1/3/4